MSLPEFAGIGAASGTVIGLLLVSCGLPEFCVYLAAAGGGILAVGLPRLPRRVPALLA